MVKIKNELEKILFYYGIPIDGDKYKIICPFHEDKNPSMIVDLSNNFYYCFGCNASGDAFNFFKNMEQKRNKNLDDIQLLRLYMQITNNTIENKKIKNICTNKNKDDIIYITQQKIIAEDYYNGLNKIDWFEINDNIKQYMKHRGFTSATLNYAKAKININDKYPIIFPILDENEFSGWVCRTDKKEIEEVRKYLYNKGFSRRNTLNGYYHSKTVVGALQRIDMPSILFFLGILLCISALQNAGILNALSTWLDKKIGNLNIIVLLIGTLSAIVDNVPLVAAGIKMYSLTNFPQDSNLWSFLAYCAGTGGSMLVIGSAAGVVAMGLAKIEFFWYLKKIAPLALIGYLSGAGVYLLQQYIIK